MKAVNLFGGAGGSCTGAREVGIDPLGIEIDAAAIATRQAVGLPTIEADVAELAPLDFGPVDLLLASAPCQAWSSAGNRGGVTDIDRVLRLTDLIFAEGHADPRSVAEEWEDPRSPLVTEPVRWALALEPRWIVLEQVPTVLGYWRHIADLLRAKGWKTWTGILECERYGVPQTRERAILIADRDRPAHPPPPTHQRFIPGEPAQGEFTLEGELLPWVSMADALGWGMTERPSVTVPAAGTSGGGPRPLDGGSGAREAIATERKAGRWIVNTGRDWKPGGDRGDAQTFDPDAQPAPAIDGKGRWHVELIQNARTKATRRNGAEPAPTITGGHDSGERVWEAQEWPWERPASAVCADPRIIGPGHKRDADYPDAPGRMENSVRVTLEEAAILQGFPPDYPFQGNRTKRFEQVGNAVPPPLMAAILRSLIGEEWT